MFRFCFSSECRFFKTDLRFCFSSECRFFKTDCASARVGSMGRRRLISLKSINTNSSGERRLVRLPRAFAPCLRRLIAALTLNFHSGERRSIANLTLNLHSPQLPVRVLGSARRLYRWIPSKACPHHGKRLSQHGQSHVPNVPQTPTASSIHRLSKRRPGSPPAPVGHFTDKRHRRNIMKHGLEERGIDRWRLDQALLPFPLVDALYGKLGIPHPFAQKHFGTHLYIDPSGACSQCRNPRSKLYVVKHKKR